MPKPNGDNSQTAKRSTVASAVALTGLMFALAMVLSFAESLLPALPALPPGIKLGLSNIVTMYCLFLLGRRYAFTVAVLKSLFVLLTRGPLASLLSLAGGLLSVAVMLLALLPARNPAGRTLVSVLGAVAHNVGQLVVVSLVLRSAYTLYYLPVMVLSGVGMGILTGLLLRILLPYLESVKKTVRSNE
jgi:heptaprenyl diphosphate synthase